MKTIKSAKHTTKALPDDEVPKQVNRSTFRSRKLDRDIRRLAPTNIPGSGCRQAQGRDPIHGSRSTGTDAAHL